MTNFPIHRDVDDVSREARTGLNPKYQEMVTAEQISRFSPQTGSTLALPEQDLTVEAVRARIAASNEAFGIKPGGNK